MTCNYPTALLLLLSLFLSLDLSAQLARKGSLGVRLEAVTEARAQTAGLSPVRGGLITEVLSGGTGEALALQNGDIILKINGEPTNDVQQIVGITQTWRAGQNLDLEVWRAGKLVSLRGQVKGKPLETSDLAEVIYSQVNFKDGKLRAIMHKPKADGNLPLLVFLQGFSCSSIDYYYLPDAPIRQLVDGLVERGFAVLRVEKPGVGDSEGSLRCEDIDYQTELDAFDAALRQLDQYDFIDTENIFYFGHSLGGVTAPLLAAEHHPKGVAVYGTVFESWYEYMQKVYRDQPYKRGDDWIRTENSAREAQRFLAALFLSNQSITEMTQDTEIKTLLENNILNFDGESRFFNRHYTFWRGLNQVNQVQAWRDAGVYSLAIYGEHDLQAIGPNGAQLIAKMVDQYHPGKGKFVELPDTEHAFAKVPSMEEYVVLLRSGGFNSRYMADHFNPELVKIVGDWMEEVMGNGIRG